MVMCTGSIGFNVIRGSGRIVRPSISRRRTSLWHPPLIRRLGVEANECFFWATHAGAELDLLAVRGRTRLGFEIKRTAALAMTRSAHVAIEDLKLQRLDVIHAGDHSFALAPRARAVAIARLFDDSEPLA